MALSTTLLGAGLFVSDRVGRPEASGAASRFVPADGAGWFSSDRDGSGAVTTSATESAIIVGSAITGALDWTLATQVIGATGSDLGVLSRTRFWRTVSTPVGKPADQGQHTRVYAVGADVRLLVESGPDGAWAYRPNLVELPAGVTAGQQWTSTGTAGAIATYTAAYAAADAADAGAGCLRVSGNITYAARKLTATRQVRKTWCPGQGVVEEVLRDDGVQQVRTRAAAPALAAPPTTDVPIHWTPDRWVSRSGTMVSADPTFGKGAVSGSPSSIPPLRLASGLMLRATSASDVVGLTPASPSEWQTRWRARPGGTILTATAVGQMWVVSTSSRHLVGYDDRGVRRWRLALDEVVTAQPGRASATELTVVTAAGEVLLVDVPTGAVRWQVRPGADVGVPAVAGQGVVVVADRNGDLIGLRQGDGTERWRAHVSGALFVAVDGQRLLVVGADDVDAFDLASGERVWRSPYSGTAKGLSAFGGWALLVTHDGLRAFDASGRVAWRRPGVYGLSSNGTYLVCWGRREAVVLDAAARPVRTFATPEQPVGSPHRFLAAGDGVYLLDSTWTWRGWVHG